MSYIKANVPRPSGNPGVGLSPKDRVTLIDVDDIAFFPERDAAGIVITDDIVMKPNKYGITLYLTPGTAEVTSPSEGDPDAKGFIPVVKFNHPGNSQEIREFKTNWLGRNCIVIVEYCNGKDTDLVGSPCTPAQLTVSYTGNSESNTNELTFTQVMKGDDIAIYKGTVTYEQPAVTVDASQTEITFTVDGQYQLQSGTAAIATVTGGSHGSVMTILGCAGESPTIPKGGAFLLKAGKTFTATEGSQITFRAFNDGDSALKWIEQSRYEV